LFARILAIVLMLLTPSLLFASSNVDTLVMKNGDTFTCEIIRLSEGVLTVKLSYAQGQIGLQWSQVAKVNSSRLFFIQTAPGDVYTGTLTTPGTSAETAVAIEVASTPQKTVEFPRTQIVKLDPNNTDFWHRFNGAVDTGILYSKGNESTQYNLSSELEYRKDRWKMNAGFDSSLASSKNSDTSVRNQVDITAARLLRRNNWFYEGTNSFLHSSVQGIDLQTTIRGGVGRYLKNTNRTSFYILGGLAWQNTQYKTYTVQQTAQNEVGALIAMQFKTFKFKRTNVALSTVIVPALSEPGRIRISSNALYYIKVLGDLSWNVSFYGNWDNRPPPTLAGSDYGTSSGLSWTFGNR
jgi:hypothetical protein